MSQRLIARLRLFGILILACTVIGLGEFALFADDDAWSRVSPAHIGFSWFVGSAMAYGFEILLVPSRYGAPIRRMHFLSAIFAKSAFLVLVVILATVIGDLVFLGHLDLDFMVDPERGFARTLLIVFALVLTLQVIIQVVRIIGAQKLLNMILGRYRQPVAEDRIFMFLDLAGSTALAERLGDVGVQRLITRFFFDISEPIAEYGGEIHQYVGDEVVVTWPLGAPEANVRAIRCAFAIADTVRAKSAGYARDFDVIPAFRIGLHGGPIVISQCGDQKQEISYFGDTINTASRVVDACKTYGRGLLISGDLLSRIALPDRFRSTLLGTVQLRGHARETDLLGVELV